MLPVVGRINLLLCLIVHLQILVFGTWIVDLANVHGSQVASLCQGIAYMLYPLCGWITEIYSYTFRAIKWSFLALLISSIGLSVVGIFLVTGLQHYASGYPIAVLSAIAIIVGLTGLGMYEANAIQFGMDQMMEASSEQLSSFIHWYFWCTHVGPLLIFYIFIGMTLLHKPLERFKTDYIEVSYSSHFGIIIIVISLVQVVAVVLGFLLAKWSKRFFDTEMTSRNSLKLIYKVIGYSIKHKVPERRRAITYSENYIPSRIDLGKDKYGGPFTYEQVEDVKTFFRLLLLIVSLFGFHLFGDGFSLTDYIITNVGCPSLISFVIMIVDPQHVQLLVVLFGVPFIQIAKRYFSLHLPNLLSRIWIGLYIVLIAVTLQTILGILIHKTDIECDITYMYHQRLPSSYVTKCLYTNYEPIANTSCSHMCCSSTDYPSNIVYAAILPLSLYGISYLLIFMTMLEFICAQSPNSMKGLLIGIWYSMLCIKYAVIHNLDKYNLLLDVIPWNIYNGIKGFGIFFSIVALSLVVKHYRYRERNEILNVQATLEEQYERELLMNESVSSYDSSSSYEVTSVTGSKRN